MKIMKHRLGFSWFIKRATKLRKRSDLLRKHRTSPSSSPTPAPVKSQDAMPPDAPKESVPPGAPKDAVSLDAARDAVPPGATQDTVPKEMSFDDMWKQAAEEFNNLCGASILEGEIKNLKDVENKIEKESQSYLNTDKESNESKEGWKKTKDFGLKILQYLGLLLPAASSAASLTPFPSAAVEMMSRALGFAINLPQQKRDYDEAVNDVFRQVSTAFAEFPIHRRIDCTPFLPQIHEILTCLVKLCALVVKHQQGSKRTAAVNQLNRSLGIDNELQQQLDRFKQAMQNKQYIQATVGYEVIQNVKQITGKTHEKVEAQHVEQNQPKILRKIGDYLDIPPTVNIHTRSTQTRVIISDRCFNKTGEWIWKHRDYCDWVGNQDNIITKSMPHVLFVLGAQSTGKTCTCAQITQRLEQERNRTYVAHYFFPNNAALKKEGDRNKISWALRYMAFQIARADETVRNSLDKACDDESVAFRQNTGYSEEELHKLWASFGIGLPGSKATYYLVFDGLENLSDPEFIALFGFVQKLDSGPTATRNLRILLSGKPEQFTDKDMLERTLKIRMGDDSKDDMPIIIKEELARKGIMLNREGNHKQRAAKKLILDNLPSKVKGNYAELLLWIDRIVEALNSSMSFTIDSLAELLSGPTQVYEAVIESLETSLTAKDIVDLNELLKHVIFRTTAPTVKQLESAMALRFGEDFVLVNGLDDMIKNKYSSILKIESVEVKVQEGFQEYLAGKAEMASREQKSLANAPSTISMTLTLNHVDRKRAAEYFWNLTQMAMQPNFTFDFNNPLKNSNQRQGEIAVDEFKAHIAIIENALKILKDKPQAEYQSNGSYLIEWLPYHLRRLRDLENKSINGLLLAHKQREIGETLYKLFTDEEVFKRHKAIFEPAYWVAHEMESLQEWLVDSAVRQRDKDWLKKALSAPSVTQGYLKDFVRWVVREFLGDRTWDVAMAYRWVEKLMEADTKSTSTTEQHFDPEVIDKWLQISEWCREALGLEFESLDSLWYERLAKAASLTDDDELDASLSIYERAIDKANPSWVCYRDMGIIHHRQGQVEEAIKKVEIAMTIAGKSDVEPKPSKTDIAELDLLLGDYAYQTEGMESADIHYRSACADGDTSQVMKGLLGCLKIKLNTVRSEDTRKWFREGLSGVTHEEDINVVLRLMARDPDHNDLFSMLFSVLDEDLELLQKVVTIMVHGSHKFKALDDSVASDWAGKESYGILLYYAGVAAYRQKQLPDGPSSIFDATSLWTHSRNELQKVSGDNAITVRSNASAALARHYFQLMLKNQNSDHLNKLQELKPNDTESDDMFDNDEVVGWLASIHTLRGRKTEAQKLLKPRLEKAISILTDDIPENDSLGLFRIHMATGACQDLTNASIAMSLIGQPDPVADALRCNDEEIDITDESNKEEVLKAYHTLSENTISLTMSVANDAPARFQRIYLAKMCVNYLENNTETETASEKPEAPSDDKRANIAAFELIKRRLDQVDVDKLSRAPRWFCDGRTEDGKQCKKQSGFNDEFYHCLYCWQRDFCRDCLGRLRDPTSNVITVCNGEHKWLLTPTYGSNIYVGTLAKTVRPPSSVEPVQGDSQVLAARYNQDLEGVVSEMTVTEWIKSIRKEYGIVDGRNQGSLI